MLVLTIRTDQPEAELGLYSDDRQLIYEVWQAHRQLAETIHLKIDQLLKKTDTSLDQLSGIVIFKGPGSFTGLRIGMAVANAFATALDKPIVACQGDDWITMGIAKLLDGNSDIIAMPEYGSLPHITLPRK